MTRAELDARPYLEQLQRAVIPTWLFNLKHAKIRNKWFLSIKFQLTRGAKILYLKLDSPNECDTVCDALVKIYEAFSRKLSHDDKPQPLDLEDHEWKKLFKDAGVSGQHTSVIKRMLKPLTEDEY